MLIDITANQSKVLLLLVETMRPEYLPGLEPDDVTDAWAVHALIQTTRPEDTMPATRGYKLTPKQPGLPVRYFEASHPSQAMTRIAQDLYSVEVMQHADYLKALADGAKVESANAQASLPIG